jgi:transcriptional regulator with XRE-family HTH domain
MTSKNLKLDNLPEFLVQMRKKRGLSQRRLAELLGVCAVSLARWEASGYATAPLERLLKIVKALGLKITVQVEDKGTRPKN